MVFTGYEIDSIQVKILEMDWRMKDIINQIITTTLKRHFWENFKTLQYRFFFLFNPIVNWPKTVIIHFK